MPRPKNTPFNKGPMERGEKPARREPSKKNLRTMQSYEEEAAERGIPVCRVIAENLEDS